MPRITPELLAKVLAVDPPYSNSNEKEYCEKLVSRLSEDEQGQAACTSYAYLIASQSKTSRPSEKCRHNMASRFARRYYVAEKGNTEVAFERMKKTLKWREELKINDLRRCYDKDINDSEKDMMENFRNQVETEYRMQESYVSGYDKQNRAILMKMHRTSPDSVSKNHLIHTVYLVERAIACTELQSVGTQEQMLSICDFAKYSRSTVPSKAASGPTIQALQSHYPECLLHHVMVWVDGGGFGRMLIKGIWAMVKMFLDPKTREKVVFIFDAKNRDNFMGERINEDQAMPFMLLNGKQTNFVDMNTFLYDVPYTCSTSEKY